MGGSLRRRGLQPDEGKAFHSHFWGQGQRGVFYLTSGVEVAGEHTPPSWLRNLCQVRQAEGFGNLRVHR